MWLAWMERDCQEGLENIDAVKIYLKKFRWNLGSPKVINFFKRLKIKFTFLIFLRKIKIISKNEIKKIIHKTNTKIRIQILQFLQKIFNKFIS